MLSRRWGTIAAARLAMRNILKALAITVAVSAPIGFALAKEPVKNVSKEKHPNLAAAQKLAVQAFEKLEAAQKANEYDMEGHAQKAKDALKLANDEIKLAAEAANKNAK
jgi:predicted lipoprotein with Yx(FWY)xxD motif